MTLSTRLHFQVPVDAEKVFGLARQAIGIPQTQPFKVEHGKASFSAAPGCTQIYSQPGGFDSMLVVSICPDGEGEPHHDYCGVSCTYHQPFFVEVYLDTAYAFEPCCTCRHYEIINNLLDAMDENPRFLWYDEFRGNWHDLRPPQRCEHHGGCLPQPCIAYNDDD